MEASSWDFVELAPILERSLMWRSKPSLARTWLQRLKRVSWMQLLSGRILRLSMDDLFVEKYTESLEDILVSHSRTQESDKEPQTPDTFGRILKNTSVQLDLFGASLKTSQDTSALDLKRSHKAFEIWVTKLRQDSLRRQKLAHLTRESDCSSWPTPAATFTGDSSEAYENRQKKVLATPGNHGRSGITLKTKVNWQTPTTTNSNQPNSGKGDSLITQANWPTPKVQNANSPGEHGQGGKDLQTTIGQPDQVKNNTTGKNRGQSKKLNPFWVESLMGLPYNWVNLFNGDWYYEEELSQETGSKGSKSGKVSRMRSNEGSATSPRRLPETTGGSDSLPDLPQEPPCSQRYMGCTKETEGVCCMRGNPLQRTQQGENMREKVLQEIGAKVCSKKMGLKYRVDMLRLLGNGVVPQCAELAFRTLINEITR